MPDDVLKCRRNEEILLFESQNLALMHVVVGVEDFRNVFAAVFVVYCCKVVAAVEVVKIEFVCAFSLPQTQIVDCRGFVTGNGNVVSLRENIFGIDEFVSLFAVVIAVCYNFAAESDAVFKVGPADFPRAAVFKPVVGNFDLIAVFNALTENSVFVSDAVAVSGKSECCHRIEETCSKSAQTAVSQTHVWLHITEFFHVVA